MPGGATVKGASGFGFAVPPFEGAETAPKCLARQHQFSVKSVPSHGGLYQLCRGVSGWVGWEGKEKLIKIFWQLRKNTPVHNSMKNVNSVPSRNTERRAISSIAGTSPLNKAGIRCVMRRRTRAEFKTKNDRGHPWPSSWALSLCVCAFSPPPGGQAKRNSGG